MQLRKQLSVSVILVFSVFAAARLLSANSSNDEPGAQDPGVRAGSINAGQPLSSLNSSQLLHYQDGQTRFQRVEQVANGLGPTYNSNSCASCHAQPALGGSSPSARQFPNLGPNPQIEAATAGGATNTIPSFIFPEGPVREARFPFVVSANGNVTNIPDGGVHGLFTISGRSDAKGCNLSQPNFQQMQELENVVFRTPTPVFGAGLIENIPDATILANMRANSRLKRALGISGHPNYSANDGTMMRFGWKAQNKSLLVFAGEAFNVEMGVTNELFTNERGDPAASCVFNATPEDSTNFSETGAQVASDIVAFSNFMRFLAPPAPSSEGIPGNPSASSIQSGRAIFSQIHCDTCHTPSLTTGNSSYTAALNNQQAALFSDLLVHHMGSGLADHIAQGNAGPDEFRTAPLWGLGQRIWFLHDGRSGPQNGGLVHAIRQHASEGSEANAVIEQYNNLTTEQKQNLLNFLRSL